MAGVHASSECFGLRAGTLVDRTPAPRGYSSLAVREPKNTRFSDDFGLCRAARLVYPEGLTRRE